MEAIKGFKGEHRFLSNFWHARIIIDNQLFPSVEHAYQAAKTYDINERNKIAICETPGQAKRLGKKITKRKNWDEVKLVVMEYCLRQKFTPTSVLGEQLLATGTAELIEDNFWGDTFWGVCNGIGENHLGKLLMKIRGELLEHS